MAPFDRFAKLGSRRPRGVLAWTRVAPNTSTGGIRLQCFPYPFTDDGCQKPLDFIPARAIAFHLRFLIFEIRNPGLKVVLGTCGRPPATFIHPTYV